MEPECLENIDVCLSSLTMIPQNHSHSSMNFERAAASSTFIMTQENSCEGLHVTGSIIHAYDSVPSINFDLTLFDATR